MAKRLYGQWTQEQMKLAMEAYRNKTYGFNECCRRFKIPKPTLKRHLKGAIKRPLSSPKKQGSLKTFPPDVEEEFVKHILYIKSSLFELNVTDVRRFAFEMAELKKIPHRFNRKTQLAGKKWYYSFLKKHPNISFVQPKSTTAQAKELNSIAADTFLNILEDTVKTNGIDAHKIFNVEQIYFSSVQKNVSERVDSDKRGINTTFLCCANAAGSFVPAMFIFEAKEIDPKVGNEAPAGSLLEVAKSGFITGDLFSKWLKHFINFIKPTLERKVILLLDADVTHAKKFETIEMARTNGVILLQLPGHTKHRLKPLDLCILEPMRKFYEYALDRWMTSNANQSISQYDVTDMIKCAYYETASIGNAVNTFKSSGCWPVNRLMFDVTDTDNNTDYDLLLNRVEQESVDLNFSDDLKNEGDSYE